MHYHMEAIIHPAFKDDLENAISEALQEYDQSYEDEDGYCNPSAYFDWYVIGGRFSNEKYLQQFDTKKLDEFWNALKERNVTVSGLQCGKQELSPSSQEEMVDELFNTFFPEWDKPCPLFKHGAGSQYENSLSYPDIASVADIPADYSCYHTIFVAQSHKGLPLIKSMYFKEIWNGVTFQKTDWDGKVSTAIERHNDSLKHAKADYRRENTVTDDWAVVTIDYHS